MKAFIVEYLVEESWRLFLVLPLFIGVICGVPASWLGFGWIGFLVGAVGAEIYAVGHFLRYWKSLHDEDAIRAVRVAQGVHGRITVECLGYVRPAQDDEYPSQSAAHQKLENYPGIAISVTNGSNGEICGLTLCFLVFADGQQVLDTEEHSATGLWPTWYVSIPPQTTRRLIWRFEISEQARVEMASRVAVKVKENDGVRLTCIGVDGKQRVLDRLLRNRL